MVVVVAPDEVVNSAESLVRRRDSVGVSRPSPGVAAVRLAGDWSHLIDRDHDPRVGLSVGELLQPTELLGELGIRLALPRLDGPERHRLFDQNLP